MPDSQMNFRIDADVRERFKRKALSDGTNANRLLIQWIEEYLASDESLGSIGSIGSIGNQDSLDSRISSQMAEVKAQLEAYVEQKMDAVLGESKA